jgi:hypothetical protein
MTMLAIIFLLTMLCWLYKQYKYNNYIKIANVGTQCKFKIDGVIYVGRISGIICMEGDCMIQICYINDDIIQFHSCKLTDTYPI